MITETGFSTPLLTADQLNLAARSDMKKRIKETRAGSEAQYGPRLAGEILHDYLENSNEPLAVAFREKKAEVDPDQLFRDFYPNTELGIDLKFITRKPGRLLVGDSINCMLTRDDDYHYTAVENAIEKKVKTVQRNPVVFAGSCVNVHLLADGTKRLEFNHPRFQSNYTFRDFCVAAAQELLTIARLLGEEDSQE